MRIVIALIVALLAGIGGARAQSPNVKNTPPFTGTTIGAGYTFTGTASTLFAANIAAYDFGLPFSVSLWVKYPTLATGSTVVNLLSGATATSTTGFSISAPASQTADSLLLQTSVFPTPGTCVGANRMCAPVALINNSNWHHLCAIWTTRGSQFWVDGTRRGFGPSGAAMTANNTYAWILGQNAPSGTIEADVGVWTRTLTQGECATIYRRGLADKSLLSGNYPTSLNEGLVGYWPLDNCTTGGGQTTCPDSTANANPFETAPPPTVAITEPITGTGCTGNPATDCTGTLTLSATCTDPFGVSSVAFLVDGTAVATDTTSPYSVTFDSILIDDVSNPHTATATCTNIGGATASSSTTFSTNNGTISPRTFYLSATGNDSNSGTDAGHPWLTPNHTMRCGDTILAAPSHLYNDANFFTGKWGTVWSCPTAVDTTGIWFATLKCDGSFVEDCFINAAFQGLGAMRISQNYWAVQGWTASSTQAQTNCFAVSSSLIHHYLWVNDYAKGCTGGGFSVGDYAAVVGSLAYGNGFNSPNCPQGISSTIPIDNNNPSDTGTHWFIGGTFVINNGNQLGCTDGNGIIWDISVTYSSQAVVEQSLVIGNGSNGITPNQSGTYFPKIISQVTTWGNGLGQGYGRISEIEVGDFGDGSHPVTGLIVDKSIMVAIGGTHVCKFNRSPPYDCSGGTGFADDYAIANAGSGIAFGCQPGAGPLTGGATCEITNSYIWDSSGNSLFINDPLGNIRLSGNTTADPGLASPAKPVTAPDCSAAATVYDCVASIRAKFVPSGGASALGYQPPGACAPDPLYPLWLKGAVPDGLLTKPCGL